MATNVDQHVGSSGSFFDLPYDSLDLIAGTDAHRVCLLNPIIAGPAGPPRFADPAMPTMEGVENVAAFWLDYNLLYLDCPFCHHAHYNCPDRSPYNDIREGDCLQKHLPKRLRGKPLYYDCSGVHRASREAKSSGFRRRTRAAAYRAISACEVLREVTP